jgi:hypothetical protein
MRRSRWRAGGGSFNLDLFLAGRIWRLLQRIWRPVEDFTRDLGRRRIYFSSASPGEAVRGGGGEEGRPQDLDGWGRGERPGRRISAGAGVGSDNGPTTITFDFF